MSEAAKHHMGAISDRVVPGERIGWDG
eukprot:SAG31_NODE_31734_length_365_cov_0.406015_1_plen_26_part_01